MAYQLFFQVIHHRGEILGFGIGSCGFWRGSRGTRGASRASGFGPRFALRLGHYGAGLETALAERNRLKRTSTVDSEGISLYHLCAD